MGASDTSSDFEKRTNTVFSEVVPTLHDSLQQDAGFLDNPGTRELIGLNVQA